MEGGGRLLFVAGRQNIPISLFQREEHPPYLNHKTIKARRLAGSVVLFLFHSIQRPQQ